MGVSVVLVLFLIYMDVDGAPGDIPSTIRSTVTSTVWTAGGGWSGINTKKEETIVFPDSLPDVKLPPHPCPDNRTKCEKNYPSNYIQQLPQEIMARFLPYFTNDSLIPGADNDPSTISTRIDPAGEYTLCESREYLNFPKDAKTTKGDTKIIVNSGHYLQGLRYELCVNPGNECALSNSLPDGYKTSCRQKYINRKLVYLTLGEKQEPVATDDFLIPSCCVCKYTPKPPAPKPNG